MKDEEFKSWLMEHLVCPRDHKRLELTRGDTLICPLQHVYPIIDEIPIMLLTDKTPTQLDIFNRTQEMVKSYRSGRDFIPSTSVQTSEDADKLDYHGGGPSSIDPYVQEVIGATCGLMYNSMVNKLFRYPIPESPLHSGEGRYFLDIGCNWGRWCVSASRRGYRPVGIDHNLEAVMAARRVAQQLNILAFYLVADARYLPFPPGIFDVVFSYSVFQHFSRDNVKSCLLEITQVLKSPGGICLIQMPNKFGIRNLYHQLRRGFKEPLNFSVRYWGLNELLGTFSNSIGPTSIHIDGFFSLNAQGAVKGLLPFWCRFVVACSDILCKAGKKLRWLKFCADSLYVNSIKE